MRTLRRHLAQRGAALQGWIADPRLKNFIVRAADGTLSDDAWIESLAALLTQRLPAAWRDEDRAKLEVAVASVSRLFRHIEALAFDAPMEADGDTAEVMRVGITTRQSPEIERVVRVPTSDYVAYADMQRSVREALGDAANNGHGETAIAALVAVAHEFLAKNEGRGPGPCKSH